LYKRACLGGLFVQPESAVSSAHNWGNWALQRQEWLEATEAYDYGRQAIDDLFATQTSRAAKEAWLREAQGLPANAAYALARLVRLEKAVATLEAGRARLLAEALEQNRRDLEQLEPLGYKAVLDRYRTASERVTALQKQASQPTTQFLRDTSQSSNHPVTQLDYSTWRQQLEQARAELDAAIAAIRQVPGYQDFFLPPSFEKIQHAATPDAPLVYLAATPVGSVALVVRAPQTLRVSVEPGSSPNGDSPANHDQTRRVSVVWLDGFNEADLDALLVERQDGQVTGGYLPGQLGDSDALHASLAQVLPRLGQALLGPLAAHLRSLGVAGVVLVPAGRLSLLPLHAASYPADGQERCLLDEFSVRYAPSAVALASAHGEAQRRRAPLRLAGVGNPLPDVATTGTWASQQARTIVQRLPAAAANPALDHARQTLQAVATATPQEAIRAGDLLLAALRDLALGGAALDLVLAALEIAQRIPPSLDYAEAELRSVLDLLPGDGAWAAYGEQATRDALWQALPAATTLHLACHGQFNPQQPLDSALLLAAGSRITLRELLERDNSAALAGLRLAFLSACQTAIADFRNVPDEAVGLPAAFLQAGIPAVVGTLWPVNDASTALLATRFYELYLHGDPAAGLAPQGPAAALQAAQRWLRDVTNAELASYLEGHRRLKEASEQQQERMSWALIKETRREVRRAVAAGQGDARPYEAAYHWAPFVFYGAG
jgi:CHAT domain-containing protein